MLRLWKHISGLGSTSLLSTGQLKRLQLVNQLSVFGMMLFLPYIVRYYSLGQIMATWVQGGTLGALLLVLWLNTQRHYLSARYLLLSACVVNLLITSSVFGFESGEHLAFLVLIGLSMLMFDLKRERLHLVMALAMVMGGFAYVEWSDYEVFDLSADLESSFLRESYVFNFVSTMVILAVIGYYFQYFSQDEAQRIADRGRAQLRSAFDHSQAGIILIDSADCTLIEVNQRARTLLGWGQDRLEGYRLDQIHLGYIPAKDLMTAIARTQASKGAQELHVVHQNGEPVWMLLETEDFDYEGDQLLHVQLIDLTRIKLYEQDLIKAKEIAQSATIAKAHFLANMSHELRTPINGILGIKDVIADEYADDEMLQAYVALLEESGERLLRTISLILDLSHLESGGIEVRQRWVDLTPMLKELTQHMRPKALAKGITFSLKLPHSGNEVFTDPTLLRRALDHIVSNAIKFTNRGTVSMSLVRTVSPRPGLTLEVRDTGIGMGAEFIQKKLFRKFEQESEGLDRNFEGAGLGLSVAKRVVDILDGQIEVESEKGEGTCFRLRLPIQVPDLAQESFSLSDINRPT